MGKETSQLTEKEALSIYARMLHTLDSSEFESFLSEDFSYSSQEVLTDMNSKDEFIEYIRPKLETIKKSKNPVYAELGVCPAYGHTDCLIMAQGDKSNLLGVAYASVDEGKICSLGLCIVPTPDSAERSGIYPGLNEQDSNLDEIDPDLNEKDSSLDKIDPSQMYVSYARPWTHAYSRKYWADYIGTKRWNEIDKASRLEIAGIAFGRIEWGPSKRAQEYADNVHEALDKCGLIKSQSNGLYELLSVVKDFYELQDIIPLNVFNRSEADDYDKILDLFKGKKFYKEFYTLLNDFENYKCEYDGSELEKFDNVPSPLEHDFEISLEEFERFILSFLEDLPGEEKEELVKEELDKDITETKKVIEVKHDARFLTSNPASLSCIQSFLRYRFAPSEVRWISEEISYFFRCNKFTFGDSCKLSALSMAKDADRAKYSIRVNQMKPKQLALLLITNVAWNELASGNHHIYRGVLSVIGNEYLRIFQVALSSSLELGYIDSDEHRDDLKKLEIAINEMG